MSDSGDLLEKLIECVKSNDTKRAREIIPELKNINVDHEKYGTILRTACSYATTGIVSLLLRRPEIDPNFGGKDKDSPLVVACKMRTKWRKDGAEGLTKSFLQIVKELLRHKYIKPNHEKPLLLTLRNNECFRMSLELIRHQKTSICFDELSLMLKIFLTYCLFIMDLISSPTVTSKKISTKPKSPTIENRNDEDVNSFGFNSFFGIVERKFRILEKNWKKPISRYSLFMKRNDLLFDSFIQHFGIKDKLCLSTEDKKKVRQLKLTCINLESVIGLYFENGYVGKVKVMKTEVKDNQEELEGENEYEKFDPFRGFSETEEIIEPKTIEDAFNRSMERKKLLEKNVSFSLVKHGYGIEFEKRSAKRGFFEFVPKSFYGVTSIVKKVLGMEEEEDLEDDVELVKVFSGDFREGVRHGSGKEYYPSGRIKFEGTYENGNRVRGCLYSDDPSFGVHPVYEGQFNVEGEFHGVGIKFNKDGEHVKGEWKNGIVEKEVKFFVRRIDFDEVGKYCVEENVIGRGGNAVIYSVRTSRIKSLREDVEKIGEYVAVKVFQFFNIRNLTFMRKRLNYCFQVLQELQDCEHIIKMYAVCESMMDLRLGCIMEKMDYSLDHIIGNDNKLVSMERKIQILQGISKGMHSLHQKYVLHRDLKPGNVCLSRNGDLRLIDFDTSRDDENNYRLLSMEYTRSNFGTSCFLAPEVFLGNYGQKADVYSFGLLVYCLIFDTNFPYGHRSNRTTTICQCQKKDQAKCNTVDLNNVHYHVSFCNLRPSLKRIRDILWNHKNLGYLQDLIQLCWDQVPENRPSFEEILKILCGEKKIVSVNIWYTKGDGSDKKSKKSVRVLCDYPPNFEQFKNDLEMNFIGTEYFLKSNELEKEIRNQSDLMYLLERSRPQIEVMEKVKRGSSLVIVEEEEESIGTMCSRKECVIEREKMRKEIERLKKELRLKNNEILNFKLKM